MKNTIAYDVPAKVENLWRLMNRDGVETRMVGGAVRDMIMRVSPKDLDFCTTATPCEMIAFAEKHGYRIEPTGLQHGTVSFIIDGVAYEFTTLRIDTNQDGRHADVTFTTDFQADAARRDFTMNAMSLDIHGEVHDYFGGWDDIQNMTIQFVGVPADRIKEDYLRVLRYFRFAARFETSMTVQDIKAISAPDVAIGLEKISRERIWAEVSKIAMAGPSARTRIMGMMIDTGVAAAIGMFPNVFASTAMARADDAPSFMAGFCGMDADGFCRAWKMSVDEREKVKYVAWAVPVTSKSIASDMIDGVRKDHVRSAAIMFAPNMTNMVDFDWPTFPVTGKDLIDEGFSQGPEMGRELARRRQVWKTAIMKEVP